MLKSRRSYRLFYCKMLESCGCNANIVLRLFATRDGRLRDVFTNPRVSQSFFFNFLNTRNKGGAVEACYDTEPFSCAALQELAEPTSCAN